MKHTIRYILILSAVLLFGACADNKISEFKAVNTTLNINLEGYKGTLSIPLTVKVINNSGVGGSASAVYEISNLDNEIVLTNLIPGQYSISISGKLTPEEAKDIFGVESELLLKANKTGVEVFENTQNIPIVIDLEISTTSALIFKEIFYAGSNYFDGVKSVTYFYEQFYEIYNNSDEVVYLDSLCISNVYPTSGVPLAFDPSLDDYVFGQSVWMIPGTGKDVPLDPGKSIVIAQSGRNHKEVFETLLDLSSADYEAYVEKLDGSAPLDYPVPNLIPAYWVQVSTVKQWLTGVMGNGMVIYKLDYPFDANDTAKPLNTTVKTLYVKIPKSAIIDAVDCLRDDSKYGEKRFPASMDAGYATVSAMYNGKSIARKILQHMPDGRIIFQDTNNSTDDFEVMDKPQIKRYLNN